jgi:exosortase
MVMTKFRFSVAQGIAAVKTVSNVATVLKVSTVVAVTLAFYLQDMTVLFANALQDEASIYILAIPVLFAYLLYRKRRMLRASVGFQRGPTRISRRLTEISGLLLCATAVVLYWFGSYTFTPLEYHVLTLPVFVAGLVLVLFNVQTLRQLAFPVVFLFFLQPPPSQILYGVGAALSVLSAEASSGLVSVFGVPSRISGQYGNPAIVITRPDGAPLRFTVDVACSGIFSLIGFVIFAAFIAYIGRNTTWKKIAILFLGLPLIVALNILRITIILGIGYAYGEQLALQVFHALGASVLMFLGTLLILVISDRFGKKTSPSKACDMCTTNPPQPSADTCTRCGRLLNYPKARLKRVDVAKIAGVVLATVLLLSIQVPVFALTEGPAQVIIQTPAGEQGNTQILPAIEGYTLQFSYRDRSFEQLAKQDASLVYAYRPTNTTRETVTVAVEIAQARSSLHEWEMCLVTWPQTLGYQSQVSQLDLRDVTILENPPIVARYFAFQYVETNDTQVVLYWFLTSTFRVNDVAQQKYVKISLIAYPRMGEPIGEVEDQLLAVGTAVAGYWEPVRTWTQVALVISQNGPALSAAMVVLLVVVLLYQTLLFRKDRQSAMRLYGKLPLQEKELVDIVEHAAKPATEEIARRMQGLVGSGEKVSSIEDRLLDAEEVGLVKREIGDREDEPFVFWRSTISAKRLVWF